MGKLKGKSQVPKIRSHPSNMTLCFSEQFPWFSFRSMTTNVRYNLESLSNGSMRESTLIGLYNRLQELSSSPWVYWTQQPKQSGLETLSYGDLKFSAGAAAVLSKDTTIYVFRFDTYQGAKKGRIIGYKNSRCSVFHIIGYDLDFSAYNHGQLLPHLIRFRWGFL